MCGFGCRRAARNGHVQPGHPIVDGGAVSIQDRQKPLCPSRTALIARQRMDRWMDSDARDETVRHGGPNARHPSHPSCGSIIGLSERTSSDVVARVIPPESVSSFIRLYLLPITLSFVMPLDR